MSNINKLSLKDPLIDFLIFLLSLLIVYYIYLEFFNKNENFKNEKKEEYNLDALYN